MRRRQRDLIRDPRRAYPPFDPAHNVAAAGGRPAL